MKTFTSETPDKDAADYISGLLGAHLNEPTLFIISGGSSLSVLSSISSKVLGPHMLVALSDERFTQSPQGNTYKQLEQTAFFKKALKKGVAFIESIPSEGELVEEFRARIEFSLDQYLQKYPKHYAIGLLGIGEDGHTASIFALTENEFEDRYASGSWYAEATAPLSNYEKRITITPSFIEEVLDDVVLFAVGENKCSLILETLHSNVLKPNQLPALLPAQHPHSVLFTDCEIQHS